MSNNQTTDPIEEETALQTVEGGALVTMNALYEEDAGIGFDSMQASDLAMPFLTILQKGSPQVDETDKRYVEGARPGMIFNTLTGIQYDGKIGIPAVACGYQKLFTEWTPRESGGGFQGHHFEDSPAVKDSKIDEKKKRHAPNGNVLVDTAYYFVMAIPPGAAFQAIVSMSSTQLKKSRKWNSIMKGILLKSKTGKSFNPPMFSHVYLLRTEPEQNDQGSWYGWNITVQKMVDDPDLYSLAKNFNEQVKSGAVRTGPPPSDADGSEVSSDGVPF